MNSIPRMIADGLRARVQRWAALKSNIPIKLSDPRFRKVFGIDGDQDSLTDPFKQLPIIRAAITAKASNIAQVPFRIKETGADEPLEKGPIVDLFSDVNPYMNAYDLWELCVIYMDGWGDAPVFIDVEQERAPGIPMFLWPAQPSQVRPALNNNRFVGWLLKVGDHEQFYLPEEAIVPKYTNPYSKLRGLSKVSALNLVNKSEWGAIKHNEVFFENGVVPGVVFETPEGVLLEDSAYNRLRQELEMSKKGVGNAHKALILEGGLQAKNLAPSNRDMQFLELRKFDREEVSMVFKVPKPELELYENINYATALSADLAFWKKTLIPLMTKIAAEFNTSFLNPRGFAGYFDIQSVDVLNREVLEKAQTAQTFVAMGYTLNQVNARLGLGFPDVEWGDEPRYMADNLIAPEKEAPKAAPEVEKKDIGIIDEIHRKIWLDVTQKIQPEVSRTTADVRDYYKRIEKKILKKMIKRVKGNIVEIKGPDEDYGWIEDLFDDSELDGIISGHQKSAAMTGIGTIETSVTLAPDKVVTSVLAAHGGERIKDINGRASKYVLLKLRKILDENIASGVPEEEAAQNIASGLKYAMDNVTRRAKTIARTEIHSAYSQARHETMEQTGPVRYRWISTHDDKVRDTHAAMDGEGKDKPDDTYSNGLRYPLDPTSDDASEVINCRCVEVAEYE